MFSSLFTKTETTRAWRWGLIAAVLTAIFIWFLPNKEATNGALIIKNIKFNLPFVYNRWWDPVLAGFLATVFGLFSRKIRTWDLFLFVFILLLVGVIVGISLGFILGIVLVFLFSIPLIFTFYEEYYDWEFSFGLAYLLAYLLVYGFAYGFVYGLVASISVAIIITLISANIFIIKSLFSLKLWKLVWSWIKVSE